MERAGQVWGSQVVEQKNFVMYPLLNWKPVELNKERCDVIGRFDVDDYSSNRVLDDVELL